LFEWGVGVWGGEEREARERSAGWGGERGEREKRGGGKRVVRVVRVAFHHTK